MLEEKACAVIRFREHYITEDIIKYRRQPKDLDKHYLKSLKHKLKGGEHEWHEKKHATNFTEKLYIEEYQTIFYEANDTSIMDGCTKDAVSKLK